MIRVLFPYVGDTVGGSHISSITLVKSLLSAPNIQPIVALESEGRLSKYLLSKEIPFYFFPRPVGGLHYGLINGLLPSLLSAPRLAVWLREERFDVVHTHDFRMHLLWSFACRLSGVKHVLHVRSLQRASRGFRLLAKLASQVITVTTFASQFLGPALAQSVVVVPNPVEPAPGSQSRRWSRSKLIEEICALETDFVVGWSGNFSGRKRPEDFIHLVANLPGPIVSRTRFLMFGDYSSVTGDKVKALIKFYSLEDSVWLIGWVDDFPQLVGGLDLLVATSEQESFGRILVEAIIAGTPVIASDIGAHSEVLRQGRFGKLFPTGDLKELISITANHLADRSERSESIKRTLTGAIFFKSFYSPEKHSERFVEIYKNVVLSGPGPVFSRKPNIF